MGFNIAIIKAIYIGIYIISILKSKMEFKYWLSRIMEYSIVLRQYISIIPAAVIFKY